jgi:16S rRNA (cytosine1402-N4)-methyltransferase
LEVDPSGKFNGGWRLATVRIRMPSPPRGDGQDTASESAYHAPVLVEPVVEILGNARHMLDGTLGGGGHSLALLQSGVAEVVGIDRDPEALAATLARLQRFVTDGRFHAYLGNYAQLETVPELSDSRFDGILLDLGISSRQVDDPSRGFTFREGAPLDMRMGGAESGGESAADLLNSIGESELAAIFREYADERGAFRLAKEIVRRRARRPFAVSDDLVDAIRGALGPRTGPPDFARLFQAVRIAVNDELSGLERALPALRDRLAPNGVFAVIGYHSGEDRLVKHAFRDWSRDCICPPRQPRCTCRGHALGDELTRKPILPDAAEIALNPRARSARLRAFRVCPAPAAA